MKRKLIFTLLLSFTVLLLSPHRSFSEKYLDYQDERIKNLLQEGVDASFRENYPAAESIFDRIILLAPQDPAGYFFKAALYQAEMVDYESNFREKEFYENVNLAKTLSLERIKANRKDPWAYLLLGNAYGSKGLYDARKGNWWSGLNNGLSAKSALKEALERNPELYDAYVGLGSYHYWASVVTKAFWWLPFFGDHRKEGMEEMTLAYEKSIFSSDAAANGLIWMYIQEKKHDLAINLSEKMQSKYPQGKSFLWGVAQAYFEKKDWKNALAKYRELLEKLEENYMDQKPENASGGTNQTSTKPDQNYNIIECQYYIANCLFSLGRYQECASVSEETLNSNFGEQVEKRQKNRLKIIQKLLEKSQALSRGEE
ncbi:MAG: tetratricopeptide repeat protein [Candidatus Zixiibacteriota bacterium]